MSTAFCKIVDAVIALLEVPQLADKVYRTHVRVIPDSASTGLSVQFEAAQPNRGEIAGAPLDWDSRLTVDCFARAVVDSADVAVDPLVEAVFARLAADSSLGGLVSDMYVLSVEAENSTEGTKTGWVRLTYVVQHRTTNYSLS